MVVCHLLLQADGEGPYPHLLRRLLRHTEIRHPELVRPLRPKNPVDPVSWAGHLGIWNRGADPFAADYPLYAQMPHQALYGTTCYRYPLAIHLLPDLIRTVDLQMRLPDPLNLQQEHRVPLRSGTAQRLVPLLCRMTPVTRWGNLQDSADRLDPEAVPVLIGETPQCFKRRSSSAWAKNALASFRISFARCSSLTSRSSSLMRLASAVLMPER